MRVIANLAAEFQEIYTRYTDSGAEGSDLVVLTTMFGDEYDHFDDDTDYLDFRMAWEKFLGEHKSKVTVQMVGMIIYLLVTYWPQGQRLHQSMAPLEKILAWEIIQEISEEIKRQSGENGNVPESSPTDLTSDSDVG